MPVTAHSPRRRRRSLACVAANPGGLYGRAVEIVAAEEGAAYRRGGSCGRGSEAHGGVSDERRLCGSFEWPDAFQPTPNRLARWRRLMRRSARVYPATRAIYTNQIAPHIELAIAGARRVMQWKGEYQPE